MTSGSSGRRETAVGENTSGSAMRSVAQRRIGHLTASGVHAVAVEELLYGWGEAGRACWRWYARGSAANKLLSGRTRSASLLSSFARACFQMFSALTTIGRMRYICHCNPATDCIRTECALRRASQTIARRMHMHQSSARITLPIFRVCCWA